MGRRWLVGVVAVVLLVVAGAAGRIYLHNCNRGHGFLRSGSWLVRKNNINS